MTFSLELQTTCLLSYTQFFPPLKFYSSNNLLQLMRWRDSQPFWLLISGGKVLHLAGRSFPLLDICGVGRPNIIAPLIWSQHLIQYNPLMIVMEIFTVLRQFPLTKLCVCQMWNKTVFNIYNNTVNTCVDLLHHWPIHFIQRKRHMNKRVLSPHKIHSYWDNGISYATTECNDCWFQIVT